MSSLTIKYLAFGAVVFATTELMDGMLHFGDVYISPNRIYVALLAGIVGLASLRKKRFSTRFNSRSRVFQILGVFLALVVLSVIKSNDQWYSLKKAAFFIGTYSVPWLVWKTLLLARVERDRTIIFILRWYLRASVFVAVFGIQQAATHLLLLDEETRSFMGINVVRINSLFYDPNFLGFFLLTGFFLITPKVQRNPLARVFSRATIIIAILLTGSQGTVVGLIIGLVSLYLSRYKKFIILKPYFIVSYVSLYIFVVPIYYERMLAFADSSGLSTLAPRVLTWYSGLVYLYNNPLLGIGPGNYTTVDRSSLLSGVIPEWQVDSIGTLAAHSNYIEIAVESGIMALIAYLAFFISVIRSIDINASSDPLMKRASAMLVATMVANSTLSFHSYGQLFLIGIFIYMVDVKNKLKSNPTRLS